MIRKTLFRMQYSQYGQIVRGHVPMSWPRGIVYVEQNYASEFLFRVNGSYERTGDHVFFIEESQPILDNLRHEIFQLHQWRPTTGIYEMFNIKKIPYKNMMMPVIMSDGSRVIGVQKLYDTQVNYDIKEWNSEQ